MARKSKKNSNGTNGVLEAERPDVDSTEIPEFVDPVCGAIAEHEEAFAAQPEQPETAYDEAAPCVEAVQAMVDMENEAYYGNGFQAKPGEPKGIQSILSPPVVVVEGMASTPKPPVAERDPLQEKIYNLNEEAFNLKAEWERLAKLTKGKKAEWEEALDEIQRLIRATHESFPLFPDKPKPKPEPFEAAAETEDEPEDDGAATILQIAQGTEGEDVAAVEDWKTIDVSALVAYGMPKKYVAILSEGGVHTIGDISALGDKHKSLTDIKGVGEAAETKINDALDGLWKARAEKESKAEASRESDETNESGIVDLDDVADSDAMHREAFDRADPSPDLPTAEEDGIEDYDYDADPDGGHHEEGEDSE